MPIPKPEEGNFAVDNKKLEEHLSAVAKAGGKHPKVTDDMLGAYERTLRLYTKLYAEKQMSFATFLVHLQTAFYSYVVKQLETWGTKESCAILHFAANEGEIRSDEWVAWILFMTWSPNFPIVLGRYAAPFANGEECEGRKKILHVAADDVSIHAHDL